MTMRETHSGFELKAVEFRIKPVLRFVVTRCETWNLPEGSKSAQPDDRRVAEQGTFDNPDQAWTVAYALCKQYHELIGWPMADPRITYPEQQVPFLIDERVKNLVQAARQFAAYVKTADLSLAGETYGVLIDALKPFEPQQSPA